MPAGRPTKFNDQIQESLKILYRRGFTDKECAKVLNIDEKTLTNWKKKYSGFFLSLKDWKLEADRKVVKSLYERACGYSHPEDKIFLGKDGEPVIVPTIKHYPPDSTAMIYWTKNRLRDPNSDLGSWSDKQEHQVTTDPENPPKWTIEVVEAPRKEK